MTGEEKKIVSGSFYKDKKNNLYQIICEAYDLENKERKVIFQSILWIIKNLSAKVRKHMVLKKCQMRMCRL